MRTSIRSVVGAFAGAVAFAGLVGSGSASAGVIYSDTMVVYDATGAIVAFTGATEADEAANGVNFTYVTPIAIDPSQDGNATILTEPGIPASVGYSDIFGICTCGPGGALALGFNSDTETQLVNFGLFPNILVETGKPVSATLYLDPGLQAAGYTAYFTSDGDVPEPAAWTLMLVGFGLAGAGLRRRNAARAAT
jgi:hypothetical protein